MSTNKTQPTQNSVEEYLNSIPDEQKRRDSWEIHALMEKLSGFKSTMWGDSIIGFGQYHYCYDSGREGDFFRCGFSPRKQNIALYLMGDSSSYNSLFDSLGKHKRGKSCLYINRLDQINVTILKEIISASLEYMNQAYPKGT